ncbi:MAG: hypothetical protein GXP44_01210 [bacterium]|nr:hypothetical protein [bacterium]
MTTLTIPKKLTKGEDLMIVPKKNYQEFLRWQKFVGKRMAEEKDTDEAIRVYKREKRAGKLKTAVSFKEILKEAKRHA